MRLYERAIRQFLGIYSKIYLKLGKTHKLRLIRVVDTAES